MEFSVTVTLYKKNFDTLRAGLKDHNRSPELKEAFVSWNNIYRAYLRTRYVLLSKGGSLQGSWKPLAPATIAARRKGKLSRESAAKRRANARKKIASRQKARQRKGQARSKRLNQKPIKPGKPPKKTGNADRDFQNARKHAARTADRIAKNQAKHAERASKTSAKRAVQVDKLKAKQFSKRESRAKRQISFQKQTDRIRASILRDTGAMFATFLPTIKDIKGVLNPRETLGFTVRFGGKGKGRYGVTLDNLMAYHHYGKGRLPARKLIVGPDQKTAQTMARVMEAAIQKVVNRNAR